MNKSPPLINFVIVNLNPYNFGLKDLRCNFYSKPYSVLTENCKLKSV